MALKRLYDEFTEAQKDDEDTASWWDRWRRYKENKDALYQQSEVDRDDLIERLGCGCECPSWI